MTQTFRIGAFVATISLSLSAHAQYTYSNEVGLTAFGNQIVDQNGNNVRLTGVNWSGFETPIGIVTGLYLAPSATFSPDFRDYLDKIKTLGFNCVRLPWSYANMNCSEPAAQDEGCNSNGTCTSTNCFDFSVCPECADKSYIQGADNQKNLKTDSDFYNQQLNAPLFRLVSGAYKAKTPLECMDEVIKYAGSIGLKVILDNHCIKSGAFASQPLWYTNEVTQQQWIDSWVILADHYKNDTYDPHHAVIACDLFNEPKMDPRTAGGSAWATEEGLTESQLPQAWNVAAEACGKAILAANPRLLIMVEGTQWANPTAVFPTGSGSSNGNKYTNWGANLMGAAVAPIDLGASYQNKLVYSIHDYPRTAQELSGGDPLPWFTASNYPNNLAEDAWRPFWGYLVENNTAPIFVGEFGSWLQKPQLLPCGYVTLSDEQVKSDKQWVNSLLHYMQGDWNLAQTINETPDSQAISVTVGDDPLKKGISFCWFGFTPNSNDTGGILDCDFSTPDDTKLDYIKPYLADMLPSYQTALASDMNGDGFVRGEDMVIFLSLWRLNTGGSRFSRGDFNHDGSRDGADLVILLGRWRSE
jgi:aryl-phospho-beta-D-glucosidase BglC (GH1 family)